MVVLCVPFVSTLFAVAPCTVRVVGRVLHVVRIPLVPAISAVHRSHQPDPSSQYCSVALNPTLKIALARNIPLHPHPDKSARSSPSSATMAPSDSYQTFHIFYPTTKPASGDPSRASEPLCHNALTAYTCGHAILTAPSCFSKLDAHAHDPAAAKLGTHEDSACPSCKVGELKRQLADLQEEMAGRPGMTEGTEEAAVRAWWELAAARQERGGIFAKGGVVKMTLSEVKGDVVWGPEQLET